MMKRFFVDSNVVLRFFTQDDERQAKEAKKLFMQAKQGAVELFCGPPVFFEIAWVLRSHFKLPHTEILYKLESLIAIPNFIVIDCELVTMAIDLARENSVGFADGYIAATALERGIGVATFNKVHFKNSGVKLWPSD
jgi:predicted nucleic acid-binding protein